MDEFDIQSNDNNSTTTTKKAKPQPVRVVSLDHEIEGHEGDSQLSERLIRAGKIALEGIARDLKNNNNSTQLVTHISFLTDEDELAPQGE